METISICPGCGKPLPADTPMRLCPQCLIKAGFNTGSESAGEGAGFVAPPIEQIAALFPQLEIIEFIGKGGMGAVYKARQAALDRFVALKILPPRLAGGPGFPERFNREAKALARLNHPNIVAVHDFGQAGGLHYLIMEYVDGLNLREIERAGRLSAEQALAIVPQICEALQFAHNEGIVHRDIKPENILLDKKGRVKITDFGIAKILGVTGDNVSLTGAKDVVGTPHYMAPEQIEKPELVDHRADIFSLGVVFYEMLTGELPLGRFQPPSQRVQVDVRLDEVVLHALEKEPARRYQQASEVKTAVETVAALPAGGGGHAPSVSKRLKFWLALILGGVFCWALMVLLTPLYIDLCERHEITTSKRAAIDPKSVVERAIATISQCAEGDPRVEEALKSLRPLDQAAVVAAIVPYLDSPTDTVRRSAIYVLWNGGFASIAPAAAKLEQLLTHEEPYTRGMAALALGQNRVAGCFEGLAEMTRHDSSGYARRCAAYALGLLGDARAKPVLQAALKDTDPLVHDNANRALEMLNGPTTAPANSTSAAAILAARRWLALADDGHYSGCWKEASAIFQGAVTDESFAKSMETFRKPLGNMVSRKLKSAEPMTTLPGMPDGQYILMQFDVSFANKASAVETVTFVQEKDGTWRCAGYYIR